MPYNECKGLGVGRRTINGPIHLLKDVDDVAEGKILVLDYPSAAYTNAIKQSLGFIAEKGGMLSHGCTLALELGLPAVVGVAEATKIFKEGELVEINALSGTVRKL